jgi:hypothetical protein
LRAAGLRSGRERKAHTPFGDADETFGKGTTFEVRLSSSQPTVFVNARYVAAALTAVRSLRRENLLPIVKLYTIKILLQLATYRRIIG